MTISITAPVELSAQVLVDLIVTAFEGGVDYWCGSARLMRQKPIIFNEGHCQVELAAKPVQQKPWYSDPLLFSGDFEIEVRYDDPDLEEGNGTAMKVIERKDIEAGLKIMAAHHTRHLADVLTEDYDATTADVFWQCVVLGDVVYG